MLGDPHKEKAGRKIRGIFFSTILDKDPFVNTSLKMFVDIRTDHNFSCFLDTIVYKVNNLLEYNEKTDILSCAFRGTLKVGPLRFKTTEINFLMGKQTDSNGMFGNGVQLTGTYSKSERSTFGIFKHHPSTCMHVRFLFAENMPGYTGSLCATVNIFGMKKSVNVTISNKDIKFQVREKIYNRFHASMNCSSRILWWEDQIFDVDGRFEKNTEDTDFISALKKELESNAKNSISQAMKRKEAVDQTVERARIRLENILSLKKAALNKLQRLISDYASAKKHFELAEKTLKSHEIDAGNYSKDVEKLKLDLDNLCNIKQCDQVCQEGIHCTTCYEYITENSKGVCPATCFRTQQWRIPPYSEAVSCSRPECERIHRKGGGFGSFFLSKATAAVATAYGAPPAVAAAVGSGITTLIETGSVDKGLCSASTRFASERHGGLAGEGAEIVANKAMSCQKKSGRWKCKVVQVKCSKRIFEYEYEHYPYECKKSCVVETIARTIEKSCCKSVTCASFVASIICVVENVVCKKARVDALERISKGKSKAKNILQNLDYARSNVSYWKIKMQKRHSRVLRQHSWVNMTMNSAYSLQRTYNSTIASKNQLEKIMSKPLKLMSLFNEQLSSADGIKIKEVRFKAKVSSDNDNKLLPMNITFQANGTLRQLSTVFDFAKINTSLKSVSEEIMVDIFANVFSNSGKKRSIYNPARPFDTLLFSLKRYHSYCTKFTNYHDILYNVAQSLYNLSSQHLLVKKALSDSNQPAFNVTSLIASSANALNQTMASQLVLEEGNYSCADDYKNDLALSEAFKLLQEEMRQNYESLNSTSKLLIYNWFATVQDIFNSSRMNYECSGMSDCTKHILDNLLRMFSVIEADGVDHIRQQVKNLGIQLEYLSNSTNTTIEEGLKISSEILSILNKMNEVEVVCAQSPNITKQPEPITETGIGKALLLNCSASGTALLYSWTFNGEILEDQKANMLKISSTTLSNSGNYTCIVSNHIAKEKSIPAVVVIHPPPMITEQPVEYLAAVLAKDASLQCEVEEMGNSVSYQWLFKPAKTSSSFAPLPNETFPYINFTPMKPKDEGWYFCRVSNAYGATRSRISFVKALSFTLPVPTAVLSFSLDRTTERFDSSVQHYDVLIFHIKEHILSRSNPNYTVHVKNLRPINCLLRKNKNERNDNVGTCTWEFQYIGRNVTSNATVDNDFRVNAGMVVNATQEVSDTIERLVNATNNGSLSFSIASNIYVAKKYSIAVHKYTFMCPRSQLLLQKDFKCGKISV